MDQQAMIALKDCFLQLSKLLADNQLYVSCDGTKIIFDSIYPCESHKIGFSMDSINNECFNKNHVYR